MSRTSNQSKALATESERKASRKYFKQSWHYYVLIAPSVIFTIIFAYIPMAGLQIAFRDYKVKKGFFGSDWVGLEHFIRFVTGDKFWPVLRNTLEINFVSMIAGLIIPIIVALMLNELRIKYLKKPIQMVLYAPHFVTTIAVCGIITLFTQRETGIINLFIQALGGEGIDFLGNPDYFVAIYVISGIWQSTGWGTIIYLAALSGVDPQIEEAAIVDGANRFQKIWHVDIPCILPTIVTMMILSAGSILATGYEKVLLLQTPLNMGKAEVIGTYIYEMGIREGQFSYATAIGFFASVVNIVVLTVVNFVAKKTTDTSIW